MRFLGTLANRSDNDDLIDAPEKRLDFQIINGEDAAKSDSAGNFMANVAGLRYCVADGEVGSKGLFDIDHTHAFSDIQKKQKALLIYLNDAVNADFTEGFLSVPEINKYFGAPGQAWCFQRVKFPPRKECSPLTENRVLGLWR